MMKVYDDIIKHGDIQLIDHILDNGYICNGCTEEASYTLIIGSKTIYVCSECLANIAHCVIDGLL